MAAPGYLWRCEILRWRCGVCRWHALPVRRRQWRWRRRRWREWRVQPDIECNATLDSRPVDIKGSKQLGLTTAHWEEAIMSMDISFVMSCTAELFIRAGSSAIRAL